MKPQKQNLTILGIKPGHDGSFAVIKNGKLALLLEAEKDNDARYAEISSRTVLKIFKQLKGIPDILAYSGWSERPYSNKIHTGTDYYGTDIGVSFPTMIMGRSAIQYNGSHERSHIPCAYGMSPFEQGRPCYALVWEGYIGSFYFIDEQVRVTKIQSPLEFPGIRYAFLYGLADPTFNLKAGQVRLSDAGKLMAICGYFPPCCNKCGGSRTSR